ncbi:MAG: FHIPEP family type III secretion protein [Treponema sp.]|nr:FHIPEP family type III secretion protein [Treponema sp.]
MANRFVNFLNSLANNFVAAAAVVVVLMLLIPVPSVLLNFLMILNIAIALIILLTVLYTPKASDLSSFPRVILFSTIFGLALNVCSTRFILKNGHVGFDMFSGDMIKAFANIVAGEDVIIGLMIFIILMIIQVVVITKGASRVSEVAARFALDSMNSKMFAVDSELQSGSITDEQAREKKASIRRESDFYSAMDGSSKFVSGNVKAGIFITIINLVGGILFAMLRHGMSWQNAINTFPKLTIGDGLLSQLPSLILSFATGILVTGSNSDEVLGEQLKKQFTVSGHIYVISGSILIFMSLVFYELPSLIFLLVSFGGLCIFVGYKMIKKEKQTFAKKLAEEQAAKSKNQTGGSPEDVSPIVPLDPLSLELGYALIPLVDKEKGAELLERVTRIRREAAIDLGLVIPRIRIIDNMTLDPNEYCFKIRGIEAGRSKIKLDHYMCLDTGMVTEKIEGEATTDPTFGLPGIWITESERPIAERNGYSIIDPPTIIATHMTEIIRSHASEILGRQEVSAIIEKIKETNPVVVNEVIDTYKYTYGEIEKILQGLLKERVSIRNIVAILETLANFGMYTPHNTWFLTEKVRETLGLQICLQYVDPQDKNLSVVQLSQSWAEKILQHKVELSGGGYAVGFDPVDGRKWINSVSSAIIAMKEKNYLPIILCPADVRQLVYSSIDRELPGVIVLSFNEVMAAGNSIKLEVMGEIVDEQ